MLIMYIALGIFIGLGSVVLVLWGISYLENIHQDLTNQKEFLENSNTTNKRLYAENDDLKEEVNKLKKELIINSCVVDRLTRDRDKLKKELDGLRMMGGPID